MPTQPIQTLQSKHFVVILIYTLIFALFAAVGIRAQQMRKGISVNLAETKNAVAMPEADTSGTWIVTITADGRLYFGVKPVTPQQLFDAMESTPRHRNAKLYIKADAHATFASLKTALGPARAVWFKDAVFLTYQPSPRNSTGVVFPQGIDVQILPQKPGVIDVRLSRQDDTSNVKVNGEAVEWPQLESTVTDLVRSRDQIVQVEAGDEVPFEDVVRVLDAACRTGVTLAVPSYHSL